MFNNLGRFLQLHHAHSVWIWNYKQHLGKMIFCRSYSSCGNRFSLVSAKDEKLTNAIKILLLQNTSNWIYAPIPPGPLYIYLGIKIIKFLGSGLLVGSYLPNQILGVYVAATPVEDGEDGPKGELDPPWMLEHAKQVLRMLPGQLSFVNTKHSI